VGTLDAIGKAAVLVLCTFCVGRPCRAPHHDDRPGPASETSCKLASSRRSAPIFTASSIRWVPTASGVTCGPGWPTERGSRSVPACWRFSCLSIIGVAVGAVAGLWQRRVGILLMGLTDFGLALPRVVLLLLLAALWRPSATLVVLVLGPDGMDDARATGLWRDPRSGGPSVRRLCGGPRRRQAKESYGVTSCPTFSAPSSSRLHSVSATPSCSSQASPTSASESSLPHRHGAG
jgi:hypothetical protein